MGATSARGSMLLSESSDSDNSLEAVLMALIHLGLSLNTHHCAGRHDLSSSIKSTANAVSAE
jgi:recombinational DNA repair protein (RecF pathway)